VTKEMKLDVPARDIQWAEDWLIRHKVDGSKPLLAVLPGGGASWGQAARFKRWPAVQYAQLIDKIIENFDAGIILMGDPKEEELCREVVSLAHFPLHFAVGETTLLGLAALFKQCQGAVVNDGGPLHVAAAAGIKSVSIFGPVDPQVYGPFPLSGHIVVQKNLPCQPCYRRFRMANCGHISCLGELSVDEVYRKVQQIL
jgi:heptosyltransferase-2